MRQKSRKRRRNLECFGGPVDGSYAPDNGGPWMVIANSQDDREVHYYRRVNIVAPWGKSLDLWHYWGRDPDQPSLPLLRPAKRKLR